MNRFISIACGVFLALFIIPAYAFDGITYYQAVIGEGDRFNSNGERLYSVADILRQDRANYYVFGNADPGDQGDSFFSSKRNRDMFGNTRIIINPGLARSIINGGAVPVTVYVFPDHIEVN